MPFRRAQPMPHCSSSRMHSGPCSQRSRASGSLHSPRPAVERVVEMMAPMVGRFGAERHRDRHLRHHGGAAAPIRLRSMRNTRHPARAASIAAYIPAPPAPITSTSVS